MTTKEAVIEMIRRLPADASVAEILAALEFRLQVDTGLRQLDEGRGIPHEEAKKQLTSGSG